MCPTLTVGSFFSHERSTFLFSSFVQKLGGGSKRGGSKHSKSQNLVQNKKKETNGRPGKHNKGPKLDISIFFGTMRHFFEIFFVTGKIFNVSKGIDPLFILWNKLEFLKAQKVHLFTILKTSRFLNLRNSADFGRSRLVFYNYIDHANRL